MLQSLEATSNAISECGLSHRLYLPEGGARRPLIVLVHGRAGNEKVMWLFSKAFEDAKPNCVSPQAPLQDPIGGYSWWIIDPEIETADPSRKATSREQLLPAVEALESFIEKAQLLYDLKPSMIIGIGFSQGAAVLSALSLKRPKLFAGVAMLSSFLPSIALSEYGPGQNTTPFFIAHGTEDEVVSFEYAQRSCERLEALGATVCFHSDAVGHKVGTSGMKALRGWLEGVMR